MAGIGPVNVTRPVPVKSQQWRGFQPFAGPLRAARFVIFDRDFLIRITPLRGAIVPKLIALAAGLKQPL
jgi:hypothetical protein